MEGIQHAGHIFLPAEEIRNAAGIFAMLFHAQYQGLQAFEMQPGVKGADGGAGVAQKDLQMIVQEILVAQHHAAQGAALTIDILGGGMDHDMGAKFHRALQSRAGKGVVHRKPRAMPVRNFGYCGNIHQR